MELKKSAEELELDREEANLRAEAASIDPARPEDANYHDDINPEPGSRAPGGESDPSQKGQRSGGDKQPAKGTDKPDTSKAAQTDPKPAEPAAKTGDKTEQKPEPDESKLTPFQKERRRLDDTWKRVQAEKDELRKQREQLEAERRAVQEQQQQKATQTPRTDGGTTAEDWDQIAKDFEAEGKLGLAKQAKARAEALRKQSHSDAPAQPRERFSPEERAAIESEWKGNLERVMKEVPELTQQDSPLRKRVAELLQTAPMLHYSGKGILYAVEYAQLEQKARRAEELEAKNAELEKEVQRLTALTALPSGGAQPPANAKKFEELSLDDQEAALREEASASV